MPMRQLPARVMITEVGTRDGLQREPYVPTARKIELIDLFSRAGVPRIEAVSFAHPKHVPQMADSAAVMAGIARRPGTLYSVLVPNAVGARRAVEGEAGSLPDELLFVISTTEAFNQANVRRSIAESLADFEEVVRIGRAAGITVAGAAAGSFGCPFEGAVSREQVFRLVEGYLDRGAHEVGIADTIGAANPRGVYDMVAAVRDRWPELTLTLHFHDTRGLGLANVLAAMEAGADRFDASIAGTGGCPFAPGATGNICTEDLVGMLHAMGIETGIDLDTLLDAARRMRETLGKDVPGHLVHIPPRAAPLSAPAAD